VIAGGCVSAAKKRPITIGFTKLFRTHVLPPKRFLLDVYTDDFLHPLAKSESKVAYTCVTA
jgi:hypothetical protein